MKVFCNRGFQGFALGRVLEVDGSRTDALMNEMAHIHAENTIIIIIYYYYFFSFRFLL